MQTIQFMVFQHSAPKTATMPPYARTFVVLCFWTLPLPQLAVTLVLGLIDGLKPSGV